MRKLSTIIMSVLCVLALSTKAQDTIAYYGWEEGTSMGPGGSIWNNTGKTWVHETAFDDAKAHTGSGYFHATVDHAPTNVWDNQGVFQEIPIADSSSYRFSMWARAIKTKADTTPSVNITSGTYKWQDIKAKYGTEISTDWAYYSLQLYVDKTDSLNLIDDNGRYKDSIRFPIHYPIPGEYFIDDVAILKSTIAGISYNKKIVAVDFGWAVDEAGGDLDASAYKVHAGGSTLTPVKAEQIIWGDTLLEPIVYLTLDTELSQASGTVVTVDFTGDDELIYTSEGPTTDDEYHVATFTGEGAYYDAGLTITSIGKDVAKANFNLFPNPVQSELNITCNNNILSVAIFDISGKMVRNIATGLTNNVSVNVADLRSGVYIVRVSDVNGNATARKLIK